ncbi:MAG: histidine--tRNA ligase [Patescibacteria group bacterium]|nr:histidine--tRNA ligase [Patescibacteria group bacterium]
MKKVIPQALKGFRDFLPEEAMKRQWLKNKIIEVFELWGYEPLETPTLEPLEIFVGQIGEGEKLFYKFKDFGGRDVALRYDQSVPTSRVIANYYSKLTFPFKRYQIQSAYRADKPQKGRYREFLQCDADIFGVPGAVADAETIALSLDIYRRLNFKDVQVLISDRALLKDMPYDAIVAIDKIKKIGKDDVLKEMTDSGISLSQAKEYLEKAENIKPNETIKTILEYLKDYGFEQGCYKFDPSIARSFSYSSGPIWEIIVPSYAGGSVLGGERYDKVVGSISGIDVAATGFALGFDRTLEAADELGLLPTFKTTSKVLVTIFSPELLEKSLDVVGKLRNQGLNTDIYPDNNIKLDKQLKYADQKGIPYVVIIGPDEVKNNLITVKNMKTKEQKTVSKEELINIVRV